MIFSTSAGRTVFYSYKDKTPLPEDVARANGHRYLAQYLQDLNTRLSKDVGIEAQSNAIDWLELVKAVQTQASAAQVKSVKEEKHPSESDDNSSDYFADSETSSNGSLGLDEANQPDSDSDSSIDKELCNIAGWYNEEPNKKLATCAPQEGPSCETPEVEKPPNREDSGAPLLDNKDRTPFEKEKPAADSKEEKDYAVGWGLIKSLSQWFSTTRKKRKDETKSATIRRFNGATFFWGPFDEGDTSGQANVHSAENPQECAEKGHLSSQRRTAPDVKYSRIIMACVVLLVLAGIMQGIEGDGKKPSSFGLPSKTPKFIGRNEECEKIARMLTSDDGDRRRAVNIVGPPGFGKTALAVMTAHQSLDLGKDMLYVSLRNVVTMTEAAVELLEVINFPVGKSPILDATQYLASCQRQTVLILDNAEDQLFGNDSPFYGLLKEIDEKATNVVTLVTSRMTLSNLNHNFFPTNFQLRPLTEEQSFLFLKNHTPGITDRQARRLSYNRVCGGVPLILKVLASCLESVIIDPAKAQRNLQNTPHKFLRAKKQQDVFDPLRAFDSRLQPDLQQALTYLAAFPTKEEAVSVLFGDMDPLEFEILLDFLKSHSVVQQDEVNGSVHYSLHPLVIAFCVVSSEETGYRMAIKRFSQHYLSLLQQLNDDFISADCKTAIDKYQMYKTNIHHALMETTEDDLLKHCGLYISTEAVNFLAKVMSMDEFMSCYVKFRDAAEALPDKTLYAECLVSVGFRQLCYYGYKDAHHTEAKRNLQEAHDLQNHHGIHDTECHGHCKCKLGLCTFIAGDQKKGISLIAQGIAVRKKRLHSEGSGKMERMLVASGFSDLAMAMFSSGKYKAAVNIWENCCLVRFRELMGTHPFTASVLYYIGDAYQKLHLPEEAVKSKKECLQMTRFLLGEDHLDTARAYYGLGCVLADLGYRDEALKNLNKAYVIQIRIHASKQDIDKTKQEIDLLQF